MFAGKEDFKIEYQGKALELFAKPIDECDTDEKYAVLADLVCSDMGFVRTQTSQRHVRLSQKKVNYFSMEFLIGRLLRNYLINLEVLDVVEEGLSDLGISLDELCECEMDPGLGNGGLGRLAACFLDSMACLGVPGVGMGIRYRFGLFQQKIVDGKQIEVPDNWLRNGYPWETRKSQEAVKVYYGGRVGYTTSEDGRNHYYLADAKPVLAVPYDVPIMGYGGKTVNILRLWSAEPVEEKLDLAAFNRGEYSAAVSERNEVEAITCILYPDDGTEAGKALRLKQEYFFVSAGTQHIVRNFKLTYGTNWDIFTEKIGIHINDTHPALCVPELMRILMDEENLEWNQAWEITRRTVSYTNHTILPEALEKWPIDLMRTLLPRVYQIIEEIDRRYCAEFDRSAENWQAKLRNTAILWDGQVRMANLSVIGSFSVNGVAALHTEILKASVLNDFYTMRPEIFNNKTNGVSHRRFLLEANPGLSALITEKIGDEWVRDAMELKKLLPYRNDTVFLQDIRNCKRKSKIRLSNYIQEHNGVSIDPDSIFDIQVKRIHAYKRQLLAAFKIMYLYNYLKDNPGKTIPPVTFLFAGKAAAGYTFAKETIKYICSVADLVNSDPAISQMMKVVFIENFNVSNAQLIYPAADISEQISTAGKEASGTGCMKFMFNGAITLGTLDGANIEIKDLVGLDNIEIFGLTSDEAMQLSSHGGYIAWDTCMADARLEKIRTQLTDGTFPYRFYNIDDNLMKGNDEYFVFKDFDAYVKGWKHLTGLYSDLPVWGGMSLTNTAMAGHFSSDRTISEYCADIWHTAYTKPRQ